MFVRIVHDGQESMYECQRYHIRSLKDGQTVNSSSAFIIDFEPCGCSVEINKKTRASLGVYVMNNEGRTIDTIFSKSADSEDLE